MTKVMSVKLRIKLRLINILFGNVKRIFGLIVSFLLLNFKQKKKRIFDCKI